MTAGTQCGYLNSARGVNEACEEDRRATPPIPAAQVCCADPGEHGGYGVTAPVVPSLEPEQT